MNSDTISASDLIVGVQSPAGISGVGQGGVINHAIILLILLLSMVSCTSMVPRKDLPPPLTNDTFADPVKVVSIPLPAIASSPNEGITYGALTAFLLHNRNDEVSTLLAPQINDNPNIGTTLTLYGAFYPSHDRSWEVNLSRSEKVNEDYEIKLRDTTMLGGKLELNAFLFRFTDGFSRFFGFQSQSTQLNETNYGDGEGGFTFSAGYAVTKNIQVVIGERFRDVAIRSGAVKKVPFIRDRFTEEEIPGIEGFTTHAQKVALVYSTLDSRDMPTSGMYARLSLEGSWKSLGSSADFSHYEAEIKGYLPALESRFISVGRVAYFQTEGSDVPFLERAILGGENSLRGYGRNRFIDRSYLLLNMEERIRLLRWRLFNVNTDWEAAPFIDFGSVMKSLARANATKDFKFNRGVGFRAVVRPNIVGRVDLGFGREGPAVFVGLGYPF